MVTKNLRGEDKYTNIKNESGSKGTCWADSGMFGPPHRGIACRMEKNASVKSNIHWVGATPTLPASDMRFRRTESVVYLFGWSFSSAHMHMFALPSSTPSHVLPPSSSPFPLFNLHQRQTGTSKRRFIYMSSFLFCLFYTCFLTDVLN